MPVLAVVALELRPALQVCARRSDAQILSREADVRSMLPVSKIITDHRDSRRAFYRSGFALAPYLMPDELKKLIQGEVRELLAGQQQPPADIIREAGNGISAPGSG
jgi:hypothetical protein